MLNDPLGKKRKKKKVGGELEVASCLGNSVLIHDGTSRYCMENKYWHLRRALIGSVSKSYAFVFVSSLALW